MSFALDAIEDALDAWLKVAVPVKWILAEQDGDRPARPYGTFRISSADPIGTGDIVTTPAGIQISERVRQSYAIQVSLNTFSPRSNPGFAFDAMASIKALAESPSVPVGTPVTVLLGFLRASETRNLSTEVNAKWEKRAQSDLVFSARFDWDRIIDAIARVDITDAESTNSITVEVP